MNLAPQYSIFIFFYDQLDILTVYNCVIYDTLIYVNQNNDKLSLNIENHKMRQN